MIKIGEIKIIEKEDNAYLKAKVDISNDTAINYKNQTFKLKNTIWRTDKDYPPKCWQEEDSGLWFTIKNKYKKYLCEERSDAFVLAFLWYAMVTGSDIKFKKPISKKLYDGITKKIIPSLCKGEYKEIKLIGPTDENKLNFEDGVGVGMTCGVDSFYSLYSNKNKSEKLTHLTYYEAGHIYQLEGILDKNCSIEQYYDKAFEIAKEKANKARDVAQKNNLKFVCVWSNLDMDYYRGGIIYRSMYSSLASTLAIQKMFKTYISSSSGHGGNLEVKLISPTQNYEELICNSCRTENLKYVSSDIERRNEKIKKIADDELCQKYLDVCFNFGDINCGECFGCLKTMFILDILNKLNKYDKVFDLEKYYKHREEKIRFFKKSTTNNALKSVAKSWEEIVGLAKKTDTEISEIILEVENN